MNANEAREWAEELGSQVKWVWWYFDSKQVKDGPFWYVEAINKINGKKRKLWKDGDEKVLVGEDDYTGNINSCKDACVSLARRIEVIWSHLKADEPKAPKS